MTAGAILVPLDGTPPARAALPVASALGEAFAAPLRILHVVPEPAGPLSQLAGRLGLDREALGTWSLESHVGEPAAAILEAARSLGAPFIVMCGHTAAAKPEGVLGRTALGVLSEAPCAVVLVPPGLRLESWRPGKILLPYDGSPAGEAAVALAGEVARRAAAEVVVLQVGAAGAGPCEDRGALSLPRYLDQPQHEWASWAGELLQRLASMAPGGRFHAHVRIRGGDPGAEILDMAREEAADLIVLSWKGVWIGEHAATLKAVLRGAACPVAVARSPGQPLSRRPA